MKKEEKNKMMDEIEKEVLNLKKSPFYKYRTENNYFPVIGEGSLSAKIMFVGEAPGKNEAKTGRPFCGTAGKVLDELLKSVGMAREDVYITNIVKDRPPENRDPSLDEIEIYGGFLDRQIEIIKPKVIATLGRHSMKYIIERFGLNAELKPISELHGKSLKVKTSYGNIEITVLYHPCVAIYNRNKLPILKEDFKMFKKLLDNK